MAVVSINDFAAEATSTEMRREEMVYERPHALTDVHTHYCPGCTHGIAHRLVAEDRKSVV